MLNHQLKLALLLLGAWQHERCQKNCVQEKALKQYNGSNSEMVSTGFYGL
jgi:hypothetical protein